MVAQRSTSSKKTVPMAIEEEEDDWVFPDGCRRRRDGTLSKIVRNFGFGSNLDKSKMTSRGLKPLRTRRAVLKEWRLAFNQRGFPPIEPSFANLEFTGNPHDEVHGVLYDLSLDDFQTLWRGEGSGDWYATTIVNCKLYDGELSVPSDEPAWESPEESLGTLKQKSSSSLPQNDCVYVSTVIFTSLAKKLTKSGIDVPPSARYANLLVAGGASAELDLKYQQRLKAIPTALAPPSLIAVMWRRRINVHQFWCRQKGILQVLFGTMNRAHGSILRWFGCYLADLNMPQLFQCYAMGIFILPNMMQLPFIWGLECLGF